MGWPGWLSYGLRPAAALLVCKPPDLWGHSRSAGDAPPGLGTMLICALLSGSRAIKCTGAGTLQGFPSAARLHRHLQEMSRETLRRAYAISLRHSCGSPELRLCLLLMAGRAEGPPQQTIYGG
jgi:hypothetical protein